MKSDPQSADSQLLGQLGWVRRLASSLARDPEVAADLVQDVACEWVARRPAWASRGAGLRAWLARTVRSRSVDRARAERARRERELAAVPEPSDEDGVSVLERLDRQRRVAAAVHALPEPYRVTILLRFLDELPTREVARRLSVPEATVRKRIERGLAMLRARLDREFGASSKVWALALVDRSWLPGATGITGSGVTTALQGGVLMGGKKILVVAAAVALASFTWLWFGADPSVADLEVGGHGVVIAESQAAAREAELLPAQRVPAAPAGATPSVPAATTKRLRGLVFVDADQRAPSDLTIAIDRPVPDPDSQLAAQLDLAAGRWALELEHDQALTLWITSASTVPAQIPVPRALLREGGTFDLHLASGRSLHLLFLDEATRAPLADLPFEVTKSIETRRSAGSVGTRGSRAAYRTDQAGRAIVVGLPAAGWVSVTTDLVPRPRAMLMRNGPALRGMMPGEPIWSMWVKAEMPEPFEQTILTRAPLGDATAAGQIPAWADAGQGPSEVRVVARKLPDGSGHRGDPFVLDQDAQGGFELRASAPSRYQVWLERAHDGAALTSQQPVVFERVGAHAPIVFAALHHESIPVHFTNVPSTGTLEILTGMLDAQVRSQRRACAGQPFSVEIAMAPGESLRIALRSDGEAPGKSAWHRDLPLATGQREVSVDLAGSWRTVQLESDVVDLHSAASVGLIACRNGEPAPAERVVVLCSDASGSKPVHVSPGRWLYMIKNSGPHAIWGVVDVGARDSGVLVLQPRLYLTPVADLRPGLRFDVIAGVSLRSLPETLRTWHPPAGEAAVALPLDATFEKATKVR